jgi:hypothetical protein
VTALQRRLSRAENLIQLPLHENTTRKLNTYAVFIERVELASRDVRILWTRPCRLTANTASSRSSNALRSIDGDDGSLL